MNKQTRDSEKEDKGPRRRTDNDASEKNRLMEVARRQRQELEMLRLEIRALKTKCGHVSMESSRPPLL